jgi:hypothetical protein
LVLPTPFPKVIASQILKGAFRFSDPIHIVCREGEIGPWFSSFKHIDSISSLADEPASSSLKTKTFNHCWAILILAFARYQLSPSNCAAISPIAE